MNAALIKLISIIADSLQVKFENPTLCTQYAWWLLQKVTNKTELQLINQENNILDDEQKKILDEYINELVNNNMPLAYLLGNTPFCGLDIMVRSPILIPRAETEEWCADLIDSLKQAKQEQLWILDLCTGTGCIALALADALPKAKVIGTDNNPAAIALAQENANHNSLNNVEFIISDVWSAIPAHFTFDIIVANPPYISPHLWHTLEADVQDWEDKNALIADDAGLALIKKIIINARNYLKKNDTFARYAIPQLVIEIDHTQANAVQEIMKQYGFAVEIKKDLQKKDRVACGRLDNVAITAGSK